MEDEKIIVSGKRKRCVARATIQNGIGKVTINKKPYYLLPELKRLLIEEPIRLAKEHLGKFDFDIEVVTSGGGQEASIEAARLAIAKAIVKISDSKELKKIFFDYDKHLLVADTRRK